MNSNNKTIFNYLDGASSLVQVIKGNSVVSTELKSEVTLAFETLFRNEQIYRHKFFALVLGMIDGWKMELMKFNKDNEYCEELNLISNLRERVLYDYKINSNIIDPKFIINALENIPCYLQIFCYRIKRPSIGYIT